MLFRKAAEEDLDGVMRIVAETVAEMRLYGNDQWDDGYPARARFQQDIISDSLYVVEADGETLGFVAADSEQPQGYARRVGDHLGRTSKCALPMLAEKLRPPLPGYRAQRRKIGYYRGLIFDPRLGSNISPSVNHVAFPTLVERRNSGLSSRRMWKRSKYRRQASESRQ